MRSTIIPLTWPEDHDPSDFRRFESEARKLRYRALAKACRENRIIRLMVAHHADDQAETVMMRLINMRWRSGLQAMQSVEWLPECYGMHGVYHSGGLGPWHNHNTMKGLPFPVEKGGMQILRPLLGFEKKRLVATCEEKDVLWAEDKTNHDPTLTARNAIRHVIKNHALPAALSVSSLVGVSRSMQTRIEAHKAYVETLFNGMHIQLDIRTGSLITRFPSIDSLLERPIRTEADRNEARNNAYLLLERLAELVSPQAKAPLSNMANAALEIYPSLAGNEESSLGTPKPKKSFCVFGVWWVPRSGLTGDAHSTEWLLARQPLHNTAADRESTRIVFPPAPSTTLLYNKQHDHLQWHLFDGRYWIRVKNHTPNPAILRPLSAAELLALTKRNPPSPDLLAMYPAGPPRDAASDAFSYMKAALALVKPGSLRRHVPALFLHDPDRGADTLLALPTLGATADLLHFPPLSWSLRYKKIDHGRRPLAELVVPGMTRRQVVAKAREMRVLGRERQGEVRWDEREKQWVGSAAEPGVDGRDEGVYRIGGEERESWTGDVDGDAAESDAWGSLTVEPQTGYEPVEKRQRGRKKPLSWQDFENRI